MAPRHRSDLHAATEMRIARDSVDREDVRELLREHMEDMLATSPPESVHALSASQLADPGIHLLTARSPDGVLLGCGVLKVIDSISGEIKSMRTARSARNRGVGRAMVRRLVGEARGRGYLFVYLETGSQDFFAPARRLYADAGFQETGPFGSYTLDPNSVYMVLHL